MAGGFRAASRFGQGQAAAVASGQNIAIPTTGPGGTVAAGDVAELYVFADGNPTLTTPTDWALRDTDSASASVRTWVFTKTLAGGDPGSNVALAGWASTIRIAAVMIVKFGVTETGWQLNKTTQGSTTSSYGIPTLTGVPANALLTAAVLRRRSGTAGAITIPSPYTSPTTGDSATAYASGVNVFGDTGYVASAGGSAGGETASTGVTSIGTNYLVSTPEIASALSGSFNPTGSGTATFGGAPSVSGSFNPTGSGTATFGGVPRPIGTLAVTGSGTTTFGGLPAVSGDLGIDGDGVLTLGAVPGLAGTLTRTGSGTLDFGSLVTDAAGALDITGDGTALFSPSTVGTDGQLTRDGSGTLTLGQGPMSAGGQLARVGEGTLAFGAIARISGSWHIVGVGLPAFVNSNASIRKWDALSEQWIPASSRKWNAATVAWIAATRHKRVGSVWV